MRSLFIILIMLVLLSSCKQKELYHSDTFAITPSKVTQDKFIAEAISATKIISNYQSDYREPTKREIFFKFSLNGDDNERFPGEDHRIILDDSGETMVSAIYTFGEADPREVIRQPVPPNPFLEKNVRVTFRCDMHPVFESFDKQGFYVTKTGEKIEKAVFEGVYIAGAQLPLTWEFTALKDLPHFKLSEKIVTVFTK